MNVDGADGTTRMQPHSNGPVIQDHEQGTATKKAVA